jgi:biopolymer transport protein TolR
MALMKSTDESGAMADINITPFVDVMLVLLVIFMVTAPLMENGIPIQLPKASAKALPPREGKTTTVLNLTKDGRIVIDKEETSLSELTQRLQQLYKNREEKEIYIRADESLPYGVVAQAMALVKNAGIHKIGLATVPPEGGREGKK